eukprot:TRINITY_DN12444_c0_g1_i2.p1 TRINITY_DN12444_c0_g1~~TRINITY_DN12444_c0_g1_i2.p1  ORF type:complete len:511 (+),score=91.01 TRINITY_DN12444_c0_g1_i2:119-1651(+)
MSDLNQSESPFTKFKALLSSRARVVERGISSESEFEQASRVFNRDIRKRPKYIIYVAGVADVIFTLNFASQNNIPFTTRSGGHSYPGLSTIDDGIVIDLSQLRGVRVSPESRTVQVEAGCLLGDLDQETIPLYNLAVPSGIFSGTGLAGLTLGGGMGYLCREYGLTIDSLLAVDIVIVDKDTSHRPVAKMVTITNSESDQYRDLFWGIRGAGSNFGVVTSFLFQLHPVSSKCYFGTVTVYSSPTFETLRAAIDFSSYELPRNWSTVTAMCRKPMPSSDPPVIKDVLEVNFFCNSPQVEQEERLQKLVAVLRSKVDDPSVVVLEGQELNFLDVQRALDAYYSSLQCCYLKSGFVGTESRGDSGPTVIPPTDEALLVLLKAYPRLAEKNGLITLIRLGGKPVDYSPTETAYWTRNAAFLFEIFSSWEENTGENINLEVYSKLRNEKVEMVRSVFHQFEPFASSGVYSNFAHPDEGEARVKATYGGNYERLVELKKKYDPDNFFWANINILKN